MPGWAIRSALALGAVLVLVGCGGESKTSNAPAPVTVTVTDAVDAAPTLQTTEEAEPTPEPEDGATDLSLGQSGKDGTLTFRVVSIGAATSVAQQFDDPLTAPAGAKLIVAKVTYRNDGKVRADPFCGGSGAVLIDDRDRNFEFDSSAAVSIAGNKICEGIQPGFRSTETLPFIVPVKANITSLAAWDSNDGDDFTGDASFLRFNR